MYIIFIYIHKLGWLPLKIDEISLIRGNRCEKITHFEQDLRIIKTYNQINPVITLLVIVKSQSVICL